MGTGTPAGMLAEMLAAGMNAHLAGFDQSASLIEKQVLKWLKSLIGSRSGQRTAGQRRHRRDWSCGSTSTARSAPSPRGRPAATSSPDRSWRTPSSDFDALLEAVLALGAEITKQETARAAASGR
jgi:hypothetical protein